MILQANKDKNLSGRVYTPTGPLMGSITVFNGLDKKFQKTERDRGIWGRAQLVKESSV